MPHRKGRGDAPFPAALQFVQVLWQLDHALNARSRRMLTVLGVTSPQRFLLRVVGLRPGTTLSQLAQHLHVTPATVTRVVRRMESSGLLRREGDSIDARKVRLHLTEAGRVIDATVDSSGENPILDVIEATSPADLAVTRKVLMALIASLERRGEDVPGRRRRRPAAS